MHTNNPLPIGSVRPSNYAYDRAPMIVYWELTLACDLVCRHCRAKAMRRALPGELSTDECKAVLDSILDFGDPLPHLILTGGDPLRRDDLEEIMSAARERGIGVSLSPSATPLLTRERMATLKDAGMQAMSLSLDGATAATHDGIRRVEGTFDHTVEAMEWAHELDIPLQVNTLVAEQTIGDLEGIRELMEQHDIMRWTLFFLIRTGRGLMLSEIEPAEAEKVLRWADQLNEIEPFEVRTTEALHFRRVAAQRMMAEGMTPEQVRATKLGRSFGVRDGNGIVFVNNQGNVTPSGFLPKILGNVKERSIVDMYRNDPLMHSLRTPESFGGKCGVCEFNNWCGGGRSRAYAVSGDPLAADPMCLYVPAQLRQPQPVSGV
ncbi:TIGR04053 family radical SAM/SPASM domain-containing protein [Ancrocorticia populi]|nr:TIGR04053 family radical SAM/SPASM domain-containing protein [Ancrocorticia populi]